MFTSQLPGRVSFKAANVWFGETLFVDATKMY